MKSRKRLLQSIIFVSFLSVLILSLSHKICAATRTFTSAKKSQKTQKWSAKKLKKRHNKKLYNYKNKSINNKKYNHKNKSTKDFTKTEKRYYKDNHNTPPTVADMQDFPTPGGAREVDSVICNNQLVLVYSKDEGDTSNVYINSIDAQGNIGREIRIDDRDPNVGNNWSINQTMRRLNPDYDLPDQLIIGDEGSHLHPRIAHNPGSDFVCVVWQYNHSDESYNYRYSLILAKWFQVREAEGITNMRREPTVVSSINDSDGLWESLNNKYAIDPEITSVTGFEHHEYALTYTLGYQLPYGSEKRFFYQVAMKLIHITRADGLCIESWEDRERVYKTPPEMSLSSKNISDNIISKDISYMEIVWEYEEAVKWKRVFLAYYINSDKIDNFHGDNTHLVSFELKMHAGKVNFINMWQEPITNIPFANPGLSMEIRGGYQFNDIFFAWRNDPHTLKCVGTSILEGGVGINRRQLEGTIYEQRFDAIVSNPNSVLLRDGQFSGELLLMYTEQETLFRQNEFGDHYIYLNHLKGVVFYDSTGYAGQRGKGLYHFYINPEIPCWNTRAVVAQGDGWPQTVCWVREMRPNYTGPQQEQWIHPLSVIDVHGIELRRQDNQRNYVDPASGLKPYWFRRGALDLDVQTALDTAEFNWRWNFWDEQSGLIWNFEEYRKISPPVFKLYLVRNEAMTVDFEPKPGVERAWIDNVNQSGWRNNIPVASHCWSYLMADFPQYGISIKSNTSQFNLEPGPDNGPERERVEINIAREGEASASTHYEGLEDPDQYHPAKTIDGVKFQDGNGEWAADEEAAPWLQINFPATDIYQVILYDRVSEQENIISGTLLFSDGSEIAVGAGTPYPIDTTGIAMIINFPQKENITWVKLQVHESQGQHPGLSEIEIFGLSAN